MFEQRASRTKQCSDREYMLVHPAKHDNDDGNDDDV